jgi:hypothetical protein
MQAEHGRHEEHAAVTVLDICGMDDGVKQQALGVYQDVALLAFDLLAGWCLSLKSGWVQASTADQTAPFTFRAAGPRR